MKSYTSMEQAKKLAEFLPLESADMRFCFSHTLSGRVTGHYPMIGREPSMGTIPCWSLAALIEVLPSIEGFKPVIDLDINQIRYEGKYRDELCFNRENLIDACVAMIKKLHEQKLL